MTTTVLVVLGFRVTITIVAIHLATAVISHLVSDYSKVTAISPEVFSFLDFTISSDLMLVAFDWVLTVVSYHLRDYYHSAVEFRFSLLSLAFTIDLMFVTVVMSSAPDFLDHLIIEVVVFVKYSGFGLVSAVAAVRYHWWSTECLLKVEEVACLIHSLPVASR